LNLPIAAAWDAAIGLRAIQLLTHRSGGVIDVRDIVLQQHSRPDSCQLSVVSNQFIVKSELWTDNWQLTTGN
jgi:hypothetical protein